MAPPAVDRIGPAAPTSDLVSAAGLPAADPAKARDARNRRVHGDIARAADAPTEVPSLLELKRKIPAHCFQPSLLVSLAYVVQDAAIITTLYVIAYWAYNHLPAALHNWVFLPVFWFFQGFMFWAVFVLGHDCGHGSFSRYPKVNSFVGYMLHSAILVPFHSWRISHRKHHKNTGNYERDEIFYPIVESEYHGKKNAIARLVVEELGFMLPLAYPLYLFKGYGHQMTNHSHMDPQSQLFGDEERGMIRTSVILWWSMVGFLVTLAAVFGPVFVLNYYVMPYLVYCFWLLMVTFLHHTEPGAVWYNSSNWDYVKGNLQSIDRVYGIFEYFHHDIGTHVVHHLFPAIPHYRLREANRALKPFLGDLHRSSDKAALPAFFESYDAFRKSYCIPDDTDVFVIPEVGKKQ
mmetsp:Transcript_42095/g.103557  ORF Transcript_42095/g.103557 Transcript_42095/m.103557 type:complete len:405 (+) Transcript_42095:65-1279(+)|eukprot:CAMPEP_0198364634 /NCGR_PEP_ID=MMETSP1450-20131203/153766_1 /TAXON_ID=753684 ORGANISM="Madagascaria erythrocladiodes, Strain CCMP3234" /NCGR_SAMPLE_ID=MMETSP1450 /ASSEMBLY_ACC=CAM_ASM_001115 /LENGTH=404 /DNA_ID=CAMNT_0044072073 /DNA_START=65 /DNA_END=1279 /DNA_ORIENTATION=-